MNFWTGLIVGWFTAAPIVILALALVRIGDDDRD